MRIVAAMWMSVEEDHYSGEGEAPNKLMFGDEWVANTNLPVGEYAVVPVDEDGALPAERVLSE